MSSYYHPGIILHEFHVLWKFINNDIWDTILPSLLAFFTAWLYSVHSWKDLPQHLILSLIYACLYIYTFCLSNQINSVEEDRINKPYRPLPTGLVSRRSTIHRIIAYNIIYLVIAYLLGIFWISIGWQIVSCLLNIWGWSNHWITKNLFGMTIGTFLLLSAQWAIASPGEGISLNTYLYFTFISLWAGASLPIQDLRDEEGDRKMGRKTLTIALGNRNGRLLMIWEYLLISPGIFLAAMLTQVTISELFNQPVSFVIFVVELLIHWLIAYRLWFYQSPKADDKTYHIFVYLFCSALPMICFI